MTARVAADAVLLLHLAFVVFVVIGGLAVLRWPRLAWLHVPALAWGAWIELSAGVCPLTPLENRLRRAAGESGYAGGFIEHYLVPLIYPAGLDATGQRWLGAALVALNLAIYATLVVRQHRRRTKTG